MKPPMIAPAQKNAALNEIEMDMDSSVVFIKLFRSSHVGP